MQFAQRTNTLNKVALLYEQSIPADTNLQCLCLAYHRLNRDGKQPCLFGPDTPSRYSILDSSKFGGRFNFSECPLAEQSKLRRQFQFHCMIQHRILNIRGYGKLSVRVE